MHTLLYLLEVLLMPNVTLSYSWLAATISVISNDGRNIVVSTACIFEAVDAVCGHAAGVGMS